MRGPPSYRGVVNDSTVVATVSFFVFPLLVLGIAWLTGRRRRR